MDQYEHRGLLERSHCRNNHIYSLYRSEFERMVFLKYRKHFLADALSRFPYRTHCGSIKLYGTHWVTRPRNQCEMEQRACKQFHIHALLTSYLFPSRTNSRIRTPWGDSRIVRIDYPLFEPLPRSYDSAGRCCDAASRTQSHQSFPTTREFFPEITKISRS